MLFSHDEQQKMPLSERASLSNSSNVFCIPGCQVLRQIDADAHSENALVREDIRKFTVKPWSAVDSIVVEYDFCPAPRLKDELLYYGGSIIRGPGLCRISCSVN